MLKPKHILPTASDKYVIQAVSGRLQPRNTFRKWHCGSQQGVTGMNVGQFYSLHFVLKRGMAGSKSGAQKYLTRPFWAVFGKAVRGEFGGYRVSLNFRLVKHHGAAKRLFGGVGGFLHKQIRIKEFNPRLIYFHYLQDWNKNNKTGSPQTGNERLSTLNGLRTEVSQIRSFPLF